MENLELRKTKHENNEKFFDTDYKNNGKRPWAEVRKKLRTTDFTE